MPSHKDRARLARDGIFNVRDLGGMPVAGGRAIAPRRLVRADSLHRARASADVLRSLGVVRVIDLRDERERDETGVLAVEGFEVEHHPVLDPMFTWTDDEHEDPTTLLARMYRQVLTSFGPRFATAVTSIAEVVGPDGRGGAVAYHCAVGKDRTGLLTALLLDALGATHETIVADYARSAATTAVQVSWLWQLGHPDGEVSDEELRTGVWSARPETMAVTLEWLGEEFGGARGYLRSSGVPDEIVDALEAGLLVDPAEQEEPHVVGR